MARSSYFRRMARLADAGALKPPRALFRTDAERPPALAAAEPSVPSGPPPGPVVPAPVSKAMPFPEESLGRSAIPAAREAVELRPPAQAKDVGHLVHRPLAETDSVPAPRAPESASIFAMAARTAARPTPETPGFFGPNVRQPIAQAKTFSQEPHPLPPTLSHPSSAHPAWPVPSILEPVAMDPKPMIRSTETREPRPTTPTITSRNPIEPQPSYPVALAEPAAAVARKPEPPRPEMSRGKVTRGDNVAPLAPALPSPPSRRVEPASEPAVIIRSLEVRIVRPQEPPPIPAPVVVAAKAPPAVLARGYPGFGLAQGY